MTKNIRGYTEEEIANIIQENINLKKEIEGIKQNLDNLDSRYNNLTDSNKELQRFNYIASHDLQSPLRTITSYSAIIQKRYKDKLDAKADEFFDYIVDAANTMKSLIDDLLNFSKIDKYKIDYRAVDLNFTISQIIKVNKTFIDENEAEINYSDMPTVKAQASHMYQLFQNLISNAIKYRRHNTKPIINITYVKNDNNCWLFKVSDNGIGIAADQYEEIFVLFKRLHGLGEYPGSGIGLSTVKKIVEIHHGEIWVESEVNKGTTFYFTLPV